MLELPREMYDAMVAHARRDDPDEACGVIAGRHGRPTRLVEMTNAARSPTFYEFDSLEQLAVWLEMDERDEEPFAVYHSHTATEAYPSRTDISLAQEPGAFYVLLSTRAELGGEVEVRAYRIVDATVEEVRLSVSAAAPD